MFVDGKHATIYAEQTLRKSASSSGNVELASAFMSPLKALVPRRASATCLLSVLPLLCLHRVEAQAFPAGGGPEVLVSPEEPDAEEPEARTE